jgi:hypothetical protein
MLSLCRFKTFVFVYLCWVCCFAGLIPAVFVVVAFGGLGFRSFCCCWCGWFGFDIFDIGFVVVFGSALLLLVNFS